MTRATQVFHTGELALQTRAGVPASYRDRVAHAIRHEMPQQHRDFFESLPVLFLGLLDARGQVWATPAVGEVGFLRSRDPGHLSVGARPQLGKAFGLMCVPGQRLALLAWSCRAAAATG